MAKGNPYHLPGGTPQGGEFTSGPITNTKNAIETNTIHGHGVEKNSDRVKTKTAIQYMLSEGRAGNFPGPHIEAIAGQYYFIDKEGNLLKGKSFSSLAHAMHEKSRLLTKVLKKL